VASDALDTARALDLAIDASPHRLVIVDDDGTIVLVNRELERQFGYAREELVGRDLDVLLPEAARHLEVARSNGDRGPAASHARRELCGRRKDGSHLRIEVEWQPLQTASGRYMLASITDLGGTGLSDDAKRATLDDQFEFERFVDQLTTQFINLPAEQLLDAIRMGLRRLCEQLHLDRGTLYRIGPDNVPFASVNWTAADVTSLDAAVPAHGRFSWSLHRILAGEIVSFSTPDDVPSESDRVSYVAGGIKSATIVPLWVSGRVAGALALDALSAHRTWPPDVTHRIRVIATTFAQVLARRQREEAMQGAAAEAQRVKEHLHEKNASLRRAVRERIGATRIVGKSAAVRQVLEKIQQVATMDSTVLLLGETGTGKELFATQIHECGSRHGRQMVRVNCAAITTTLIESELFGREKGAFTGSLSRQIGRFEMADHSTLFLDEIGDLPPEVQVKLLRVLEERKFERLGSPRSITVDTRIIAATHRNLETLIADGTFREDLYYRLSVFPIYVPPLRERLEDIPLLVWRFVEEFAKTFGKRIESIDAESLAALQQYPWPGNIRELRNVVERAMIVVTSSQLTIPLPQSSVSATKRSSRLADVEKEHIRAVVESTGWRIRGSGGAADQLGLRPTTLETRMAKLGLKRPSPA
jgi:PAS domain S-box-containing protein